MAYFAKVVSLEDLKSQYRDLAKKNHPDAGGDPAVMTAINLEFDVLFPIWQKRHNDVSAVKDTDSAKDSRYRFYTDFGWAGDKYDPMMTTKEVAAAVRAYVKDIYPTYKFSVRFSTASMCSEVHIDLKETPIPPFKGFDDLTEDEVLGVWSKAQRNYWVSDRGILDDAMMAELRDAYGKHRFLSVLNDVVAAVIEDVDREVRSYQFDDCDGMVDYFHVNFYWFGVKTDDVKMVPKTARLKSGKGKVAKAGADDSAPAAIPADCGDFSVTEGVHTKTGEKIFVVKIVKKLDRDTYLKVADAMKGIGGYYSRFVHGFVFKTDPSDKLNNVA